MLNLEVFPLLIFAEAHYLKKIFSKQQSKPFCYDVYLILEATDMVKPWLQPTTPKGGSRGKGCQTLSTWRNKQKLFKSLQKIFENLHTNLPKKIILKTNPQFQFLSSCLPLPLFDFRLKSHYLENLFFFLLSSFFSQVYYLPKMFYSNQVFHSLLQHVAVWSPNI